MLEANSRADYRQQLEKELKEVADSEMWQAGAQVRALARNGKGSDAVLSRDSTRSARVMRSPWVAANRELIDNAMSLVATLHCHSSVIRFAAALALFSHQFSRFSLAE